MILIRLTHIIRFRLLYLFLIGLLFHNSPTIAQTRAENLNVILDSYLSDHMQEAGIPGISVVIIQNGKETYRRSIGYSNIEKHTLVTDNTLFEIGSNTKAFTALGILQLEKQGRLRLTDDIRKYLPDLKFQISIKGRIIYPVITIAHLLHHTGGIPFHTIDMIVPDTSDRAFATLGKRLYGTTLNALPGKQYQYATVNYDLLGWIIEKVSNQSYEHYMQQQVLSPLGLKDTFFNRKDAGDLLASGYKFAWLTPTLYLSPVYRSNMPAGYLMANIRDITKWLHLQLNKKGDSTMLALIRSSHIPDKTVSPQPDGASYAAGWLVYPDSAGTIAHGGSNPNFSSYMLVSPNTGTAVAILANLNSAYTASMADGILNILNNTKPVNTNDGDMYEKLDTAAFIVSILSSVFILFSLFFFLRFCKEIIRKERIYTWHYELGSITRIIIGIGFLILLGYCLYIVPHTLFDKLSWTFLKVWAPVSLVSSLQLFYIAVVAFYLYYFCETVYTKEMEKSYYVLAVLSCLSGIGNTVIILIINVAVGRKDPFLSGFVWYFVLGLYCYIYHQSELRRSLITIVHNKVYTIRYKMISLLLDSPYQNIEDSRKENIINVLVSDTEQVSNFPNVLIAMITSIVTLICCFIYLGGINVWALCISILTILIAATLYFYVSKSAKKIWEQSRTMQNEYVRYIDDLINGFKELRLNNKRSIDFEADISRNNQEYKNKNIIGGIMFANVFIAGELIFTLVIGMVAFILPLILLGLETNKIATFVFVFLYMTGPVNMVLNAFPQITRIKISWARIAQLQQDLTRLAVTNYRQSEVNETVPFEKISLNKVQYSYRDKGADFIIGPVNYSFNAGEIVFITGGNGSGKSSLAKLLCGLYVPDKGDITLNGSYIKNADLSQFFSAIFSDYHLFDKLYGIDSSNCKEAIEKYLHILELGGKTDIKDGAFTVTHLSTGQKKRLALLTCYLEDKPVYLFDEWAADQDPVFKRFFYEELLPDLKSKGKCVVVISHDDRYFNIADRVLVMESGKIIENKVFGSDIIIK